MKKLIAILLVVCVLFVGVVTYINRDKIIKTEPSPAELYGASSSAAAASDIDFDALYSLYAPDTVVFTVNGEDVRWRDYCAFLYRYCQNAKNLFATYAMYGMDLGWDSPYDESGITVADYLPGAAEDTFVQALAIMDTAKEYGVELSDDSLAVLDEGLKADIASLCGEGATEEDFYKALEEQYMSPELYEYNRRLSCYSADIYAAVFGENSEKVKDADAVKWLDDNGYMTAGHILFLTVDPSTGEQLDDAAKAEKLRKATEVYEELKAIEDNEERKARFIELKTELCEDSGKAAYPVAYVFQSGVMVPEFEETVVSLGDYELSEPVKTDYGYHVILRLPHDPDLPVYSSSGERMTARTAYASAALTDIFDARVDAAAVEYLNGFTAPDLTDYTK